MLNKKRRKFITLFGGVAATWPLAARAQQVEQVRRVGALMSYPENAPAGQLRATVFRQGLEKRGWSVSRNLEIDYHWGVDDADWMRSGSGRL